tara:strand:- start:115 stop:327 length:213 start_codon:yes stop_codon:yes gene_type:complete
MLAVMLTEHLLGLVLIKTLLVAVAVLQLLVVMAVQLAIVVQAVLVEQEQQQISQVHLLLIQVVAVVEVLV